MPTPRRDLDALHALARGQGGVLTAQQARDHGVSAKAEHRRVASGAWERRGRALVIRSLAVEGDLLHAWVLQAQSGTRAIVSGPVAARLGGWDIPGGERIVILPEHARHLLPGIRVLRRDNPAWPVAPTGLRLARPLDALADTLICRRFYEARELVDLALQRRWIDAESFDALIGHRAGRGRRGVGRLRALFPRVASGQHSEAEQRMHTLLVRSGTGMWSPNYPVRDAGGGIIAELDFAHLRARIAIEVDGRAFHSDERAFERDRLRQNHLVLLGWRVLRFTWAQITEEPESVIDRVRAAVADEPNSGTFIGPNRPENGRKGPKKG